ncbi:hypothetical protein [Sedimentimonas flavescens]|uniref:hypothetical protein n=1 Tax=Sedimentimonas flavescens TaxID=2851012 RepID=UPI001C49E115|nr:hypothetical protein [Sedimentimonas flavescens]MBW0157795.1 hypothetical protein [Sedimentimonas flavescens]
MRDEHAGQDRADAPVPPNAPTAGPGGPAGRRPARFGIWLLLSLPVIALAAIFAFMAVTHVPIRLPVWAVERVEARANSALEGRMRVSLAGGADLIVDEGGVPRVRFQMVEITRPSGMPLAVFAEMRATLWSQPLLRGKVELRGFRVRGATLALRRMADGRIDLDLGGAGALSGLQIGTLSEATDLFEAAFETSALSKVEQILAEDVRIRLNDERLGRVWQVSEGRFRLTQNREQIAVTLSLDAGQRDELPAQLALSATTQKRSKEASFGAVVTSVPARDLAVQSPALAVLGVLDAPISGSLRSGLDAQGQLKLMEGSLEVGAGAISPAEGAIPLPFAGGKLFLSYDGKTQRVRVSDMSFQSRALRLKGSGQALLRDFRNGLPSALLAQVAISDLRLDPEGIFDKPARFSQGAADLRISLSPFKVELGQLQLIEGERRISARGEASADAAGWRVALDAGVDRIAQEDLLALWPRALVPPTRKWLADNVATGELQNVRAAVRLAPEAAPRLALSYEFRGAQVRILRSLPPVQEGRGFATIHEFSHALMVEEGHVIAPEGGQIEVADSVMVVPDVRIKPAPAEVKLITRSPIPAALSLLDQPPFEFMTKAGRTPDIAEGWAEAQTELRFVMKRKIAPTEVDFDVTARLTDVQSDKVVPGHVLSSPLLRLSADRSGIAISGRGDLSGTRFDARWSQQFGPENKGISAVRGYVEITPEGLETFRVGLPEGTVSGVGWGSLALDLTAGAPARYRIESDLKGLGLRIPQIGWSKPAEAKGNLKVAGLLGMPPVVETLALRAPGLSADGKVSVKAEGGLERAEFDKLVIADWFDGGAALIGRGEGRAPDVQILSGALDMRRAALGGGSGGAGGTGISVALDRLTISEGIALTGLRGTFSTQGGLKGTFAGNVNGGAPVEGVVGPADNGRTAARITAADAGAAIASAGIFSKARGGALDMTLSPVGAHSYEGRAHVANLRVKDAPVLASMLSAASIIGLLEQLNGEGILFTEVDAAFRLTPEGLSLTRGEAVGASMGVTMTGNYYPGSGQIDMQGVISPFYMVNAIGGIFSGRREGLFGFTYSLSGQVAAPRVAINPLSIFTPGMFREIFRREPPKLEAR